MENETVIEPIENVNSGIWKYIKINYLPYVTIYIVVCFVVFFFVSKEFGLYLLFFVGVTGFLIIYKKVKRQFTIDFGKSIGFSYVEKAARETVSGRLFDTGHGQSLTDVLSGIYNNIPMRIFTFTFTIGQGKSSHTYAYTVFEATLTGTVPHILLFSNKHESIVSDWFSGNETLKLEGDFNKYFKLRIPDGHGQEACEIFTPDVMTYLIDMAHELSFEFIDNKLYIYAVKVIMEKADFQNMFNLSNYLIKVFNKNTARINIT